MAYIGNDGTKDVFAKLEHGNVTIVRVDTPTATLIQDVLKKYLDVVLAVRIIRNKHDCSLILAKDIADYYRDIIRKDNQPSLGDLLRAKLDYNGSAN